MKKIIRFSDYMEWANFGFGREPENKPKKIDNDAKPINPINCEIIMQELENMGPLGTYQPNHAWQDILEWGTEIGAMKIDVSPLGSYKIIARRKIKDIQGENTWICKYIFPLNEHDDDKNEISLAHTIREQMEKITFETLDSPKRGDYPDFAYLVDKITTAVRYNYPSYCMFPKGVKKINEDYYKIYFEFKGHGVEAPTRGRAEQFDIDLLWDRKKGLIRCWGYDIDSSVGQHSWKPQPSEWDEWFAPSQPIEEIIECVTRIFMTY